MIFYIFIWLDSLHLNQQLFSKMHLCTVALPYSAVVGLQCLIVVSPDHTHLLFSHIGTSFPGLNKYLAADKCWML